MRKRILNQCLQIALSKNNPEMHPQWGHFHHFTFIVQNNKILGIGFNRDVSQNSQHPLAHWGYKYKLHAETDAFRRVKALINFEKPWSVVNVRLNKLNEIRMSSPCSCCSNFLNSVGCSTVYFTTDIGFAKMMI